MLHTFQDEVYFDHNAAQGAALNLKEYSLPPLIIVYFYLLLTKHVYSMEAFYSFYFGQWPQEWPQRVLLFSCTNDLPS